MQQPEYGDVQVASPNSKRKLVVAIVAVVVLIAIAATAAYVIINNQTRSSVANAGPAPAIPSKDEVGQLISSNDDDIKAAAVDHSAAAAALEQASTPVKVDL